MSDFLNKEISLAIANELVKAIQDGDSAKTSELIDDLTRIKESEMFRELGKLTRELHSALATFQLDSKIEGIIGDIPDAKERLSYVIQKTDEAAHKTLDLVEKSTDMMGGFVNAASSLIEPWDHFVKREMSVEEFRGLVANTRDFLSLAVTDGATIRSNLNEVLLAQDFQDITGQIIRKVIALVQKVEENLVDIIRVSGGKFSSADGASDSAKSKDEDHHSLAGPQIPGMETATAVSGQDEVDDLLASLGF